MGKALELSKDNFEQEVIKSNVPVLVDFWAPWCGPCQIMGPVLDDLAGEMDGKLKIAKLNVDDPANNQLAVEYQIMSIPNMKLFKEGKVVKDFIGARSKEMLKDDLQESL